MEEIRKKQEVITYSFNEKEQNKILKRILDNRKSDLKFYWDYSDKLSEEQIFKILLEEYGLYDIENDLYDCNTDYMFNLVNEILNEELTEKEKTDKDLMEFLRAELEGEWDFNQKDLVKNSSINLRIELLSNEDMINLKYYKESDTYKDFKRMFKGCFKVKDLNTEIENSICDYGLITFFFKVSGEDILKLRKQIQKGFIEIQKGFNFGIFNYYIGSGGYLDIELKKPIKLKLKNWNGRKERYYNLGIYADNLNKYGIQETYGLTGDRWVNWKSKRLKDLDLKSKKEVFK